MLTTFVLVIHALIALSLVGVILLQRSEGGGLGIGGGNAGGMLTARGAADLLTRSTTILAAMFIATSILLAVLAATGKRAHVIDTSLAKTTTTSTTTTAPGAPASAAGIQLVPNGIARPAAPKSATAPVDSVPLAK
jgi:preprotein translocase subunit SecG